LRCRVLTPAQIHYALFPPGNLSGCIRTLTQLTRHRWVDRLERASINHPYIYLLSSKSTVGNKILRDTHGEQAFKASLFRLGPLEHQLALNDVRIRAEKDGVVDRWRRPEELVQRLGPKLQPDAYFRVQGEGKVTGHFLELQRSLKSHRVLLSKLARYQQLFTSEGFHNQAMKVLVVFTTEYNRTGQQRVVHALKNTPDRYPFVSFAGLDAIKALPAGSFYTAPIWFQPGSTQPVGLRQEEARQSRRRLVPRPHLP